MKSIVTVVLGLFLVGCANRQLAPIGVIPSMRCVKDETPVAVEFSGEKALWECQRSRCSESEQIRYVRKGFSLSYICVDKTKIEAEREREEKALEDERKAAEAKEEDLKRQKEDELRAREFEKIRLRKERIEAERLKEKLEAERAANQPSIKCHNINLTNTTAAEKVNAAMCYGANVSCRFNSSTNITSCYGPKSSYSIVWKDLNKITVGKVYDGSVLTAIVYQADDGSFRYRNAKTNTEIGFCYITGDVAKICVW